MDWDGLGKILTGKEIPLETSSNRSKRLMMSICVHRLTLQWVRIWNEKICCCWCADTVCFSRKKSFLWSSKYNDQMMLLLLTTMIDVYIYKEREREILFFLIDFTFVMVSDTVNDVWFLFHLASYEVQLLYTYYICLKKAWN